jgi:hypothetical protein
MPQHLIRVDALDAEVDEGVRDLDLLGRGGRHLVRANLVRANGLPMRGWVHVRDEVVVGDP